jgi:hypothetical protein
MTIVNGKVFPALTAIYRIFTDSIMEKRFIGIKRDYASMRHAVAVVRVNQRGKP